MTDFTPAGIKARHELLDVCEGCIDQLEQSAETEGLLANIQTARGMLNEGNVRAAHSVARDVRGALERAGHDTEKLGHQMKVAHATG